MSTNRWIAIYTNIGKYLTADDFALRKFPRNVERYYNNPLQLPIYPWPFLQ